MPTLEAHSVRKVYHLHGVEIRAVDDISLAIQPGEFVALMGPSGSGKTTMLALLAGLLHPDAGEIRINGQALHTLRKAELAAFRLSNIGFTFQANNLVPYLTVRENVELMLRLNGKLDRNGRTRTQDLLKRLDLDNRMDNLPSQLSGGQQQRVAIARALVHEPSIVLADEPTASLDTNRAHQVVSTLANLIHEQGRAGVMVSHDPRMCAYADRVLHMQDGRLVEES
ncbi:ABC transporter ATP-binding protein [Oscillochloris trichoides DG-6]|uniref:ABC transporter ATP-binding protein n=1 Tax=Oscillochloris trichoides DG-6 TaxID=765420 RepID=E1ID59_9CHLR|nr:ABC transporter ATP-binding protein [Oscillochloris trichoides]EFO80891.1 ABC transporter ATP-binding protein [Oscillochloris trichoides DG-6]